jgi:RimJ/RimL family protein N-acetyltransferase
VIDVDRRRVLTARRPGRNSLDSAARHCLDEGMLRGRVVGLREQRSEDLEALFPMFSDAEHVALADDRPFQPQSLTAWRAEFEKKEAEPNPSSAFFTIQRLDDPAGTPCGDVGLWGIDAFHRRAHIGIQLLPAARGLGLGRDALEVICRFGFEIRGLERLALETLEVNAAMQATAVACGFVQEGRLRGATWYLGRRADELLYGLLADEWRGRPVPGASA